MSMKKRSWISSISDNVYSKLYDFSKKIKTLPDKWRTRYSEQNKTLHGLISDGLNNQHEESVNANDKSSPDK